jgi:hypothetical protein
VDDTNWSRASYDRLILNKKTTLEADYNDSKNKCYVVLCSKESEELMTALSYCVKLKKEKQLPLEQILTLVPRFSSGKRLAFHNLKVKNIYLCCKSFFIRFDANFVAF